ncbi:hypothetical protein AVEN_233886-1 [Araneus ventricosus]|uniref:Uncharacterized protein n=1 Tax=Araneus ventricosus TaxID=182803 RepID=A0A4Y2UNH7_ARAVE|nr:hypothetical protein AVEN_233886-1 [Araneus ventricosus]
MVFTIRHTNTKKKRMGVYKKHDMQIFYCLRNNDGDGKMEFQGLSDSCEVIQIAEKKKEEISLAAGRGVRDTGEDKGKSTKDVRVKKRLIKFKVL